MIVNARCSCQSFYNWRKNPMETATCVDAHVISKKLWLCIAWIEYSFFDVDKTTWILIWLKRHMHKMKDGTIRCTIVQEEEKNRLFTVIEETVPIIKRIQIIVKIFTIGCLALTFCCIILIFIWSTLIRQVVAIWFLWYFECFAKYAWFLYIRFSI